MKKRVNVTLDPQIHRKAKRLGLNVSKVAENALREAVRRLKEGKRPFPDHSPVQPGKQGEKKSVQEILKDYSRFVRNVLDRSELTVTQHCRYIGRLLRRAGKNPERISRSEIINYLESEKPMGKSKRGNIVSALRVFFREYVETDIAESFKFPQVGPRLTKVPTKQELQTFYKHLKMKKYKALFLVYATSGLRSRELQELKMEEIDFDRRMLLPQKRSRTKQAWVSFYNPEAQRALKEYLPHRKPDDKRLFQTSREGISKRFRGISQESGVKITPRMLRRWFASEMVSLGVDSTYIDAFCGRTPKSVLEKHYLDFSPRRLEEIYRKAGIEVLEE